MRFKVFDPNFDITQEGSLGYGSPTLHKAAYYEDFRLDADNSWGPNHDPRCSTDLRYKDDKYRPDIRFYGSKHYYVDDEEFERWDGCGDCHENVRIEDRVEIARACLIEAGYTYLAAYIQQNRRGHPCFKGNFRTDEEVLAVSRALRIAHMGDDEGAIVLCCKENSEYAMEQVMQAAGGWMPACYPCQMSEGAFNLDGS